MKNLKGIYLASFRAYHPKHNIIYQDINGKRDIPGDMMEIDLSSYDYIIATPPCNYYSIANYRRNQSKYALNTKHLLPDILYKLAVLGKPFIVENVRNNHLFSENGVFDVVNKFGLFVYFVGRHTYFTNCMINLTCEQIIDNIINKSSSNRQGGENVHKVIEIFIDYVEREYRK